MFTSYFYRSMEKASLHLKANTVLDTITINNPALHAAQSFPVKECKVATTYGLS